MNYDAYLETVQENILHYLRQGKICSNLNAKNGDTKKDYNGFNSLLLGMISDRYFDGDSRFYTSKQIQKMGLHLKDGEQASFPAYYFQSQGYRKILDENGNPVLDEKGLPKKKQVSFKPVFMVSNVYNAKQIEGISEFRAEDYPELPINSKFIEKILEESDISILKESRDKYNNDNELYSNLLYERVKTSGKFINHDPKTNEMINEFAASILCNKANVKYIQKDTPVFTSSKSESLAEYLSDPIAFKKFYEDIDKTITYLTQPSRREQLLKDINKNQKENEKAKGRNNIYKFYQDHPEIPHIVIRNVANLELDDLEKKEFDAIKQGQILGLSGTDYRLKKLNEYYTKEGKSTEISFDIKYRHEGKSFSFSTKYFPGKEPITNDNAITTHIDQYADSIINSTDGNFTQKQKDFQREFVKKLFVPYLDLHIEANRIASINGKRETSAYTEYVSSWCKATRENATLSPEGITKKTLLTEQQFVIAKKLAKRDLPDPSPVNKDEPYIIIGKSTDAILKEETKLSLLDAQSYFDKSSAEALLNPGKPITYARIEPYFPGDSYERSYWFKPYKEISPVIEKNQQGGEKPTHALVDFLDYRESHINQNGSIKGIADYLDKEIKLSELEKCINSKGHTIKDKGYKSYVKLYIENARSNLVRDPNASIKALLTPEEYKKSMDKQQETAKKLLDGMKKKESQKKTQVKR